MSGLTTDPCRPTTPRNYPRDRLVQDVMGQYRGLLRFHETKQSKMWDNTRSVEDALGYSIMSTQPADVIGIPSLVNRRGHLRHRTRSYQSPRISLGTLLESQFQSFINPTIHLFPRLKKRWILALDNLVARNTARVLKTFQNASVGSHARDLPKIIQAAYHLIPYFIFNPEEGSRSALFAATDPQVPEYCEMLKADEWPVSAFISQDCRPTNPSEEAHNVETAYRVWEKTLELIGLPPDDVERLVEGEEIECNYGASST